MSPRIASPFLVVSFTALLVGCGDGLLADSSAGTPTLSASAATCVDLEESEALGGVGPDGGAWVTGTLALRFIDRDGASQAVAARFGETENLVAWKSSRAFVVSESQLWDTSFETSNPFTLPDTLGKPRFACGDPNAKSGSFILGTRGLFERRGEAWRRWDIPLDVFESMTMQHVSGSCSTRSEILYLTTDDNMLWEVRHGSNAFFREIGSLEGTQQLSGDAEYGLVRLSFGVLSLYDGSGWRDIPFDGGFVTHMSAAGGVLWAAVRDKLFRRDRFGRWEEIDTDPGFVSIDGVSAYSAGGAWVLDGRRLCHVGHPETVLVDGIRPFERFDEANPPRQLVVSADADAAMDLRATIDGRKVHADGASGSWTLGDLGILKPGWHLLQLDLEGPLGPVRRSIPFAVDGELVVISEPTVFWETDVKPIFDRYCAACHGHGGAQRFLGDYETFSASANGALDLIKGAEMPPPPQPGPTPQEVAVIETWIQEGMAP